jgi:hypothetical protein
MPSVKFKGTTGKICRRGRGLEVLRESNISFLHHAGRGG